MPEAGARRAAVLLQRRNLERALAAAALGLCLALLGARALDYCYGRLASDSGVFASAAYHLSQGRALYAEVWDHKPPGVIWIDALAMTLGGPSLEAIRAVESAFAVAGLGAFFGLARAVLGAALPALLFTLAFHAVFYGPGINAFGNHSEEYAAVLALLGACGVALAERLPAPRRLLALVGAGACFAAAALTKEPFLLSAPPWLALAAWRHGRRGLGAFGAGASAVAAAALLALAADGSLGAWLDVLSYNAAYASYFGAAAGPAARFAEAAGALAQHLASVHPALLPLAVLGLVGACDRRFARDLRGLPPALAAGLLFDVAGASLSGKAHPHYFLQTAAGGVLCMALGAAWLVRWLPAPRREAAVRTLLPLCVCLAFLWPLDGHRRHLLGLLNGPGEVRPHPVSEYVRRHTRASDRIWAGLGGGGVTQVYFESRRLSPTPYLYLYSHLLLDSWRSSAEEKLARVQRDLAADPPELIVWSEPFFRRDYSEGRPEWAPRMQPLLAWIDAHYQPEARVRRWQILRRRAEWAGSRWPDADSARQLRISESPLSPMRALVP